MTTAPAPRKRRADAERSIASIIDAAIETFSARPDASMADVAAAAGVGRVTLYAHFASREALLDAAVHHVTTPVLAMLDAARLDDGPASETLGRVIREAWPAIGRVWALTAAAGADSPMSSPHHSGPFLVRIEELIARGQLDGSFRTDMPRGWLVAAFHSLVMAAGQEVRDGRLDEARAADLLITTLHAIVAGPGATSVLDGA
jgi:AcrR family transcriptional regulator